MKRCGQQTALHDGSAAAGFDPIKLTIEIDPVCHAEPPIEVDQVRAAAQKHVLAVVDGGRFVIGGVERIRSGAAAQKGPCFIQRNLLTGRAKCDGRCKTGETAAYNGDVA